MKQETMDCSDLEKTACPLCASVMASIEQRFPPFSVLRCEECSLVYLSPRLRESAVRTLYEQEGYFGHNEPLGYTDYAAQETSLRATFRRFIRKLESCGITGGSMLEVGCGYGFFLAEARHLFTRRVGIELSATAAEHARDVSGDEVFVGDLGVLPQGAQDFDVIVALNVIEHIYSPLSLLRHLDSRLKEGGRIVLATPDIGSFWYKILGRKWPSFKVPEHIAFYDESTLSDLLKRCGFSGVVRLPFPHAFPLGLVAGKLGLSIPVALWQKTIWLPGTMVACVAQKHEAR